MLVVDVDAINEKLADIVSFRGQMDEEVARVRRDLRLTTRKANFYRCKFLRRIIEAMKHIDYISSQYVKPLESEYEEIYDPDDEFPQLEVSDLFAEVQRCKATIIKLKEKEESLVMQEATLKEEEVDLINARNWWLAKKEEYETSTSKARFEVEMEQGIQQITQKVCNFDRYISFSENPNPVSDKKISSKSINQSHYA